MMHSRMKTDSAFPARIGSEAPGLRAVLLGSVAAVIAGGAWADPLPTGGNVVAGDVSIAQPGPQNMTITQSSDRAVVNWNSFSIGQDAHVDIRQPGADSAILNRVTGDTTSEIHGQLTANGQVHLINPNGIYIGPDGTVDTGAFVASTLGISDEDFLSGQLHYYGNGNSATVTNEGRITIGRGGYAALLGGRVRNSGVVTVPLGRIGFGSGERMTLDLSGDQFLQVAVPTGGEDDGEALIEHSGLASADGGLIEMRAATARQAVRHAVNLTGVAEARSVSMHNGAIVLGGGQGGRVTVSGRVSTRSDLAASAVSSSVRPRERPEITITGQQIALAGAEIDASHTDGGGLIRIGGDFGGQGDLPRADTVTADAATEIRADALVDGQGGEIVVWSDGLTDFAGNLSAQGGAEGGDGGFIEVSGKETLHYSGLADTRAPHGDWGTLLLDPTDVVVDPGAGGETMVESNLATTNFVLDTTAAGPDAGNITVNADLDWTATTTLEMNAVGSVTLNGAINGPNGGLLIDSGSTITTGPGGSVDVADFRLNTGFWSQVGPALPAFSADTFSIGFSATFLRALGGDGSLADPYQLFDIYGLQGVGSNGMTAQNYVLANDIDATGTSNWVSFFGSSEGFDPIFGFGGTLDGAGHAIDGLYIYNFNGEGFSSAGLFAFIGPNGQVMDLAITNADITGGDAGILAATNEGTINAVWADGSVTGVGGNVGGLIGNNFGTVADSVADVSVLGQSDLFSSSFYDVGGFVGTNVGIIDRSHALGTVDVSSLFSGETIAAGGFAGSNFEGTITDSYAQVTVEIDSANGPGTSVEAGGFTGVQGGSVTRSYSTGSVTMIGDATTTIGGFAGTDLSGLGPTPSNFWDMESSGIATDPIATGLTTAEFQTTGTFMTIAGAQGWNFFTTWAPGDTGFYPVNYTTSSVVFAIPDPVTEQYGLTPFATTTGPVFGGPGLFVFDNPGDTLDSAPIFATLGFADQNAGPTTFVVDTSGLTSGDGVPYRVVDLPGDAVITPAPLTIVADDGTKTYGQPGVLTFSTVGTLYFADSVDAVDLTSPGAQADANVAGSPYVIDIANPTGPGLSNYDITLVPGALTVTPAPLTIVADNDTKTYGELFVPTSFSTVGTLYFSDSVDAVELTSAGSDISAEVAGSPYAIDIGNPTGTGLSNYDITLVPGELTINPAPLTITANDQVKDPGEELVFNGTEFTVSGLVFSADAVASVTLTSAGAPAGASPAGSPYPVVASDPVGTRLDNYDITFVDGSLTVTFAGDSVPRPPVVTKVGLPNPTDNIIYGVQPGSGSGTGGVVPGSGGSEIGAALDTLAEVQEISGDLVLAARACSQQGDDVTRYLACLSDALNDLAEELDAISSDLPPGMENVASIIQTARADIDRARQRAEERLAGATTEAERDAISREAVAEAQAALSTASGEIRKAIVLVRAEDPELAALQRETITTVADAVDSVNIELSRAVGL